MKMIKGMIMDGNSFFNIHNFIKKTEKENTCRANVGSDRV